MKYTLVLPNGTHGQSRDFPDAPPVLTPNKGRWLPDTKPEFNPATHVVTAVLPVPDNATSVPYAVTPRPLDAVKAEKIAVLESNRRMAVVADVTVAGKVYPADPEYREVISNLVSRSSRGKPLPLTLRGKDGIPISLTPTLLGNIEDAIAGQMQAAWDRFWSRYDSVQEAATVEAVMAVVW